ncbi:hypothetical protein [Aliikangiella sp. IMCC44359]|uniref:hypothetical protein n=1 Tax=Aliikangiella sp. IMCC44359 TaxID=3459125 RepID=UPI00403B113D
MKNIILLGIVLLTILSTANSAEYKKQYQFEESFKWLIQVGGSKGGDGTEPLPLFNRGDGQYYTGIPLTVVGPWQGVSADLPQAWEDDIEAGGLFSASLGAEIPLFSRIVLMTTLGYQYDSINGDLTDGSGGKGSMKIARNTLDLIPFYNLGRHRVGLGLSYHINPKAIHKEYGSSFDLKTTYHFDNGIGATLQYDYLINKNISLGVKLTKMSYDFDKLSTRYTIGATDNINTISCVSNCKELLEADSVGVNLSYHF